jgi:hypothetical protein
MIRHVVLLKWNDEVDEAHIDAAGVTLSKLPGCIPQILDYQHGRDLGVADGNFDYAVTGVFASVDDFVAYRDHPDHQSFVNTYLVGHVNERRAVQFEVH